ncbi:MAG TPA: dienelactone hydrolase family protein [Candidatus Binatia bacterium]
MNTQHLDYTDGEIMCEAYVAYDESQTSKRPCVLVSHQWSGQSDAEREKAEQLAQLGYVGFAIDIYGKGVRGGLLDDNSKLIQPFLMTVRCSAGASSRRSRRPKGAPWSPLIESGQSAIASADCACWTWRAARRRA